jgi:hypothetical protein
MHTSYSENQVIIVISSLNTSYLKLIVFLLDIV